MKKNKAPGATSKLMMSAGSPTKTGTKVVPTAAPKLNRTANQTTVRTAKPNKR